jgi:hypothetical protein
MQQSLHISLKIIFYQNDKGEFSLAPHVCTEDDKMSTETTYAYMEGGKVQKLSHISQKRLFYMKMISR